MEQKELIKELCESIISFEEGEDDCTCNGADCDLCPFNDYNCGIIQENITFYQSLAQQWLDENFPKKKEEEEELVIWNRSNFDLEKFKNENIAINCDTEEKAKDLLHFLGENGVVWCSDEDLTEDICWRCYEENTCYDFDEDDDGLTFCNTNDYNDLDYEMVKWEIVDMEEDVVLCDEELEPCKNMETIEEGKETIWNRNNFDLEKFKNENIAIHCDTEEKAKDLLTLLSKSEVTWCDGEDLTEAICWGCCKENTCYNFDKDDNGLTFCNTNDYNGLNYKMVKWEIIEENNKPSNEEIKENETVKNNSVNKQVKVHILSGCSASGKDTILKEVVKKSNIVPIISTTSRPMREGEVEGREYYFKTYRECEKLLQDGMFIESRMYNTKNGSWLYGITKDSIDLKSDNEYIVIVDAQGRDTLIDYLLNNNVDRDNIRTYYIDSSARERLLRSLSREINADTEQVLEMCRRTIADYDEVEKYKHTYDYILKNETDEDLQRCIGCIVGEKNLEKVVDKLNKIS